MFIEISPHEGVYRAIGWKSNSLLKESYRLNLNFVQKVFFETTDAYENEKGLISVSEFDRYKDKCKAEDTPGYRAMRNLLGDSDDVSEINERYDNPEKITLNEITFGIISPVRGDYCNYGYEWMTLYFTREGHGEYQRIKRIIDENTFR